MQELLVILAFFIHHTGIDLDRREVLCMAENVYHEARGQSLEGQIAVAQVTMNRAESNEKTVCEVVFSPWQFTWTMVETEIDDLEAWEASIKVSALVMSGAYRTGFSMGATHYYAPKYANPEWAGRFVKVAEIDDHIFMIDPK